MTNVRERLENLGRWPLLAIAFTCTLLLALGAPHDGITWLIWLGFAPLALVARLPQVTPKRAFLLGWVGGLCSGLVGFPWVGELLVRFADFSPWLAFLGLFTFSAYTAVPFAIWALGINLGPRGGWRGVGWAVVLFVAVADLWPEIFPYTAVIGLAEQPVWIQAAEIGGVALCEAQVVTFGVLLADAIVTPSRRTRRICVAVAIAIPLASTLLGSWRMAALDAEAETAPRVKFGVVQANTPLRWPVRLPKLRRLHRMSRKAQEQGAQVIVWPEAGVYPFRMKRPLTRDYRDPRRRVLLGYSLPTIFGVATYERGVVYEYNSVANMTADGNITGTFDKVNLMPFGEYIPIVDPDWARSIVPAMAHNLAGDGPARFVVHPAMTDAGSDHAPIHVGPLICYEDIFPEFARETAAQDGGIEVFVNVTIDTWFGDTAEPWEHLALAQWRSVEHRIPMVRSVAAGVSSVVDHNGRLAAFLPVRAPTREDPEAIPPELLLTDVAIVRNTVERPTLFALGGWLLPWLCQFLVGGVVLARVGRTFYSRRGAAKDGATPENDDGESTADQ